jgi:uncharacterized protein YbaR (Trm112 family)
MRLIDKDALVSEIERRLNYRINSLKAINNGTFWKEGQSEDEFNESLTRCAFNAVKNELFELKCFTDTLEVKEVDLEKEVDKILEENDWDYDEMDFYDIAKHFFELGLRSTITEEDCKLIWNIGDEIPNMPEEEFFKELLKRYKAKKGEEV